jgi:hypothetical protein
MPRLSAPSSAKKKQNQKNFGVVRETEVPRSRMGKHHAIVKEILNDLEDLESGMAIQVPLAHLNHSKENVRSALNRALLKKKINAATATDETFFYIWKK